MRASIIISAILAASAVSDCDSAPQWSSDNYEIYSIGGPLQRRLGVDVGGGTQALVMPQVIGVGEDTRWIVVKRHPNGDVTKTEYFYLPKSNRDKQLKGSDAAIGPFSEEEFELKAKELNLPSFSRNF